MLKNGDTRTTEQAKWKTDRATGFLLIGFSYFVALIIGLIVYRFAGQSIWVNLLWADIAATLVIWICSLVFDNASVYDPYWSVQPIVILTLLVFQAGININLLIVCAVVVIWGVRLTANWMLTFRGLLEQDWRYDQIKNSTGKFYPIVNLLGIQLMPTLIVFACIAPLVYVILQNKASFLQVLPGLLISLSGITLEAVADRQMRDFRLKSPGRTTIIHEGLWKYSRHPNYLGEILMWWGAYLVCLAVDPSSWRLGLGAVLNTVLFLFISIPMAEKHMAEYKDGFQEYQQRTRILLPLPKRSR
jgi:steroid 5-alpha reductase family enzyme